MRGTVVRLAFGFALALALPVAPVAAQQEPRAPVPPARFEGVPIKLVYVDLRDTTDVVLPDSALVARIRDVFGVREGVRFTQLGADIGLARVRRLAAVRTARWELYETALPGTVVLALRVVVEQGVEGVKGKGVFTSGRAGDFPTLIETPGALLRVQLNGGLGAYDDRVPWWGDADAFVGGSPLFPDPAQESATWGEYSVEAGVHGAAQIASHSFVFGSVTGVGAGSVGQDPWRSDFRFEVELEKAYGGFGLELPRADLGFSISYGQQTFQLNKGFLFSQYAGGFNAAEWGASYIAARIALERAGLAKLRWRKFTLEGFLIDPQEYPPADSRTAYAGGHLRFNDPKTFDVGAAYYEVPRSNTTYLLPDGSRAPREGLRTINLRVLSSRAGGVPGLQLEAEYAHQWNRNFAMSATAWYAELGYESVRRAWRPNVSYRYAVFQGDDPATATYERFDAPQSSGSDTWLQGNILRKTVVNSNVRSHRVRLGLAPAANLNVVLNYFHLWADQRNNLGGSRPLQNLAGDTYGDELDLTVSWGINRHLFLLGLAGIALPGDAIDRALAGDARNWRSLQLSLFWTL